MAGWFLIPCLHELRNEFNDLSPQRDKGADGSVGDTAHQAQPTSDHNPDLKGRVLALDIDSTGPWPGLTFDQAVQLIVARCRSGAEDRIEYIIWNRKIYSRSYGFATRAYTGTADPHTSHAHFSARHDHHGESDTRGWNLLSLEDDMDAAALTAWLKSADAQAALSAWGKSTDGRAALAAAAGIGVHGQRIGKSTTTIGMAFERLLAADGVDETALAAAMAPAIAEQVLAALPEGALTAADVETAVRNVLRTGVDS